MANWFKVYETDLDDSKFQLLVDENPTVIPVWFWILTECAKFKDGVIEFKFEPRYFRMIGKKINQDSACISEALNALHKDGFIILGENSIELMGWESRQSEFMRKQKGKEIKKVKESLNLSPDKDLTMSEVRPDNVPIRREEKEEKEEKEENIIIPVFSENCTDLSSKLDSKNNFPNSNFSLNQPVSPPIEEAISKESEEKKPSRSASKGKNPFNIDYTEGFIKFWKAFTPHGDKRQSFEYWKEFKLEAQTERVLKALELYHLELQAQPWREKIHGERFLKNLLAGYFDKLEDPETLISPAEKDNQIQARRDEIRPKWMYEMADRQKNKEKTIEFNDWLAQNNMPELIKVYTYTD
jgi:hypothetical protein